MAAIESLRALADEMEADTLTPYIVFMQKSVGLSVQEVTDAIELFEKRSLEMTEYIDNLEKAMLTAVAQDSGSKDYQMKFEAARREIVTACTEHIAKFNIVMISLKRYHQSEPGFQTDEFFNFVKSKVAAFRPIYFKYFKMVEVDITMAILGTEIYFEAGS